ncbi:molybdenum cofactor cytidylyltransferase [Cognatiyoonia sediminum]|uniref:Molybdenum cofactor cytidylyltransferase n=1 Tax=Cognatiyoonia sediminum TaxID=1508389 RepID=A0A1M5S474_9RHOB|nr:nucleotidyltransferase family protein [Cognatiyoonia sediminum]SHH33279.1 molybdenum cofactor cytidylyltransferase [Cognatiyoonia sediminum]
MKDVSAILLAAGLSRRMGQKNKLLLPVEGRPMVCHVAETYIDVVDGPLIVVTGFEEDHIRQALKGLSITFARNEAFSTGQAGSVAKGSSVAPEAKAILVGLADQPLLKACDLQELLEARRRHAQVKITVPTKNGQRGNPIVIPAALRSRLTENPDKPGCIHFTRAHPETVQKVEFSTDGFFTDVDTPQDFAKVLQTKEEAVI